ncbi:copper resistance protein CopC [Lentzea sp. BCCO 10_0798]|uniref:Copper resistance protein CopC n=1 Tax=Lentzea kristufekii TaxID=3095430 RepID=A0ABU4TKQ6_9PSEU|nr:copper resistance protein CopC [Lentzea sp. BCCO 10_0798]MDX8048466.1 copper resistance protein CopC [Lentzea sp. BCCO 10_0798]
MTVRLIPAVLSALALALLGTAPANATTRLESSDPAEGTTLVAAPAAATLTFSEEVDLGSASITLAGPDASPVTLAAPTAAGRVVTQPLPALPNGTLTLNFKVLSVDGHEVIGAVKFTLNAPVPTTTTTVPPTTTAPLSSSVAPAGAQSTDSGGSSSLGWILGGAALLIVAAGVAVWLVRRKA